MTSRVIHVQCTACGHAEERTVDPQDVRRRHNGDLEPLRCRDCASLSAAIATRPWALSYADQQLLRRMRIVVDHRPST